MAKRIRFNVQLIAEDLADRGWLPTDLANHAGCSDKTISRFLAGTTQTPRTAKKIADALGRAVSRYRVKSAVAA